MRISDWSSDVCSSDLETDDIDARPDGAMRALAEQRDEQRRQAERFAAVIIDEREGEPGDGVDGIGRQRPVEEHRRHGEGRGGGVGRALVRERGWPYG